MLTESELLSGAVLPLVSKLSTPSVIRLSSLIAIRLRPGSDAYSSELRVSQGISASSGSPAGKETGTAAESCGAGAGTARSDAPPQEAVSSAAIVSNREAKRPALPGISLLILVLHVKVESKLKLDSR